MASSHKSLSFTSRFGSRLQHVLVREFEGAFGYLPPRCSLASAAGSRKGEEMAAIKELRARTGAPVKDVKAALETANWQIGEYDSVIQ